MHFMYGICLKKSKEKRKIQQMKRNNKIAVENSIIREVPVELLLDLLPTDAGWTRKKSNIEIEVEEEAKS